MPNPPPARPLSYNRFSYRGKRYEVPSLSASDPVILLPRPEQCRTRHGSGEPILQHMNQPWDIRRFLVPRKPLSLGMVRGEDLATFAHPGNIRVLDMPIKFPDCDEYRLPGQLGQFTGVVQRIADYEHSVNPRHRDYFAYLTVDQRPVKAGSLHREAPCHVDGFQGARWHPRCLGSHTYTVSDVLPTAYYVQPFDLTALDEKVHDFFWEMNAQVADTREAHRWQPQAAEITLMDCYTVHRGTEAPHDTPRTWLRLSFEERRRVYDRLGNAHNPLFSYDWDMVERDIEQLGLVAYRPDCDPSLRVFPWQDLDGQALPPGTPKTKPVLR